MVVNVLTWHKGRLIIVNHCREHRSKSTSHNIGNNLVKDSTNNYWSIVLHLLRIFVLRFIERFIDSALLKEFSNSNYNVIFYILPVGFKEFSTKAIKAWSF